jgi:hypothetical protein
MIKQYILLSEYNWFVTIFYAVDCYNIDEILTELELIECSDSNLKKAYDNLSECNLNTGLTYSNSSLRESVVVVGLTSNASEFFNSVSHENVHLAVQIANALKLDKNSEEFCYLVGNIAQEEYSYCKHLISDCNCLK